MCLDLGVEYVSDTVVGRTSLDGELCRGYSDRLGLLDDTISTKTQHVDLCRGVQTLGNYATEKLCL